MLQEAQFGENSAPEQYQNIIRQSFADWLQVMVVMDTIPVGLWAICTCVGAAGQSCWAVRDSVLIYQGYDRFIRLPTVMLKRPFKNRSH